MANAAVLYLAHSAAQMNDDQVANAKVTMQTMLSDYAVDPSLVDFQQVVNDLAADTGLDKATASALVSRGYLSAGDLLDADAEELMNIPGVDADALQQTLDELNAR